LNLLLPNKATEVFVSWLNANEDERAKAILLVYTRDQPTASHQRYFVYLLNAIWDRHNSASALRLLVYEVMAVDFGYVIEHLSTQLPGSSPAVEVSDFIRDFARNADNRAFVDIVRTRDQAAIQQLIAESVATTSEHDPVSEVFRSLLKLAVQELQLALPKRRR
jgi:hypothetical protein